jgi:hypothetical protein
MTKVMSPFQFPQLQMIIRRSDLIIRQRIMLRITDDIRKVDLKLPLQQQQEPQSSGGNRYTTLYDLTVKGCQKKFRNTLTVNSFP